MRFLIKNKKAALDKKKLLIIIGIAAILLIGIAWYFGGFGIFSSKSEIEASGVWAEIKKGADWVSNYLFGLPFNQKAKNALGIKEGFWAIFGSFWLEFLYGLFAGLIMWGGAFIMRGIIKGINNKAMASGVFRNKNEIKMDVIWLNFFAGGLGRVLIIAITYAALMQVDIVNGFIKLITFYRFTPFWLHPFVIAIYLGYIPAAIESYLKWRDYRRMYNYALGMKAGKVILQVTGGVK